MREPDRPVAVIVPAAGAGERLGAGVPKALAELCGEPILVHAVRAILAEPRIGLIVLAAPAGLAEAMADLIAPYAVGRSVRAVEGGATRAESVRRALGQVPGDLPVVLVHDAARCLVPVEVVSAVIDAVLGGAPAVVPGLPVVDTVRELTARGDSRMIDREALRAVQTPQGFSADVLRRAHALGDPLATDDAGMVEALGLPILMVPGSPRALKVTTAMDMIVAAAILACMASSTDTGGQSHPQEHSPGMSSGPPPGASGRGAP